MCKGATGAVLLCKGAKVELSRGRGRVGGKELAAVFGPGVLLGFYASGLADLEEFGAMGQGPVELLLDGGGATGCDK
jgi:hypothetical protein